MKIPHSQNHNETQRGKTMITFTELTLNACLIDGCYYGKAEFQMTCTMNDLYGLNEQGIYYVDFNLPHHVENIDSKFDVFKREYKTPEGEKGIQVDLLDTRSGLLHPAVSTDPHFLDLLVAFSKY